MADAILPDVSSHATFGGEKRNVRPIRVPDAEVDADEFNALVGSVVGASHTACRAWARVTISGGTATLADHDAVWGSTDAVKPTVARASAGRFTVTWATSYDDLRDTPDTHTTNIRAADVSAYHASSSRISMAAATAANVITVRVDDAAGSAADPDQFTVFAY